MTREEAIKMLKSKMDGNTDTSYEWAETVRMAIKALEQEPKWIPVSERLPKAGESNEYVDDVERYYLVQNEYGDMLVARYTRGEYWEQIYQLKPIDDEIVAWMPSPKPYVPDINIGNMTESEG